MKQLRRIYSMSDADLSQTTSRIKDAGIRDLPNLADQSVDQITIDRIVIKQTDFNNCETDEEMMGYLRVTTQSRNSLQKRLLEKLHQGVMKAKFYYGEDNGNYTSYAIGAISHDSHPVVIRKVTRALRLFKKQQADLVGEGMTAAFIQDYEDLVVAYINAVDDQVDAIMERNAKVRERTILGNELYALLNTLAEKGKLCWMYSNETLYNDYIIYPHTTPTGQMFDSFIPSQSVVSHPMADVEPTTEITITNTGTTNLQVFFADEPTDESGPQFVLVIAGAQTTAVASDIGFNEATNFTSFNVFNTGAVQGSYKVHWP